jgi:hypothetical protein
MYSLKNAMIMQYTKILFEYAIEVVMLYLTASRAKNNNNNEYYSMQWQIYLICFMK